MIFFYFFPLPVVAFLINDASKLDILASEYQIQVLMSLEVSETGDYLNICYLQSWLNNVQFLSICIGVFLKRDPKNITFTDSALWDGPNHL